jgi:type IV secretion system protein VirD4
MIDMSWLVRWIYTTAYKIIKITLIFTGVWVTVAYLVVMSVFMPHFHTEHPKISNIVTTIICLYPFYAFPRNVIRIITKHPDFSFIGIIFKINSNRIKSNTEVIKKLSDSKPKGFIFGKYLVKFIRKPSNRDGHILVIGGAGSGKSTCIAIPSLLSWNHRVLAIDIKGELRKKTRRKFKTAKIFNPMSQNNKYGYDPYYLLSTSHSLTQDAREIAQSIIQKTSDTKDPFWIDGAQNLLTGAIIYFYSLGYSFSRTVYQIQSTPVDELIKEISASTYTEAKFFVNQFIGMDIKTLSGIYAELSNKIMVFATDPDLKRALSEGETITPKDIENGYDVFIHIPEDKLEQWQSLLTLIVNQFMKHFERRPDENAIPVLFLLDEFPRLGKVESAITGLATLRSKKITICLIVQSLAQLDAIYGKENRQVIADNCQYKAILNATDADTQEYFSRLIGTFDKAKKSTNANMNPVKFDVSSGISRTTEERRIIKPEQFATLKKIVLLTPYGYLQVKKTPYYSERAFKNV